jgi:hypothetical protein
VKKVDFALPLAGVAETVQVTAESPMVDVRQPSRQSNIRNEMVELLPKGRDFTTLVTQAPGANNEDKLGGLSIDGASAGENRYIIDGIETTNLQDGTNAKALIVDFIEEVQVKSSGYSAEYGGAMGGVVNVLTKSGTNQMRGTALFNWEGSALQGARRPTLRQNLANSDIAEYVDYPKDDRNRLEPAIGIGGPIIMNRAWFFGSYQPALTTIQREITTASSQNPNATTASVEQKLQVQYITANATSQLTNSLRSRVAYNNSWSKTKGLLPALNGTDPVGSNYTKTSEFPNVSYSGQLDWVASQNLFFGIRAGYWSSDQHDSNVTEEPVIRWTTTTNVGLPGVPVELQRPTNFRSIPDNNKTDYDQQTRLNFQADGTWYGRAAGNHQVKFGLQADRLGNKVLAGETGNLVTIRWNTPLSTGVPVQRGPFGYYEVRTNAVDPKRGFITEGDIHMNVIGLFVNDSWTINDRLTLNLGIRTEQERVPNYTTGEGIRDFGIEFDFADKIAPRLGFAYDLRGDGRWKAFGSWGLFYDIFKLELPRGSFGGDKWLSTYYTLDTPDWRTIVSNPNCPTLTQALGTTGTCSGTLIRGPIDFRHVAGVFDPADPTAGGVDPDLKPMRLQEATFGIDHQLNDVMAVGVHYVHKQVDTAIEDTGSLDAQGNEVYAIANPGEGVVEFAFTNPDVRLPKPIRDYDSVEFYFDKRYANRWFLRTSYLWSRLHGNYSGLSQSDENGRTSPNVGRLFDYPLMMFQDGGTPAIGPLPTDRPHQFKAQLIYQLPFGTSVGLNEYVASGLPVTRELGIYPTSNLPVQYKGRGSDGRTPVLSQTDLYLQHGFRLGDREFQISLNVLNLFNQDTAISRYSTYQKVNGVVPDEVLFYTGRQTLESLITSQAVVRDPRFLMDNDFQAPIQARLGFKFIF